MKQEDEKERNRRRELSSAHLRHFRKDVMKCSQEKLAEKLGLTQITLTRYESQKCDVSNNSARKLAELSGYIPEYWLGLTEQKTERAYIEECESAAAEDFAKDIDIQRRKIEQRRTLLNLCGYGYEDLSDGSYDFLCFSNDPDKKQDADHADRGYPHKLTNYHNPKLSTPVYFSSSELNQLLEEVRNLIGYACYKKSIEK